MEIECNDQRNKNQSRFFDPGIGSSPLKEIPTSFEIFCMRTCNAFGMGEC